MKISSVDQNQLHSRLKHLVAGIFRPDLIEPDNISDDEPLLGLGLGSSDALELALCIEEEFGVTIRNPEDAYHAFASIASLADFIQDRAQASSIPPYHSRTRRNIFHALTSPSTG